MARGVRRILLQLPTGSGKTLIAATMAAGKRCIFTVPRLELVNQTHAKFLQSGIEAGVIQGYNELTDASRPVQVASIQTLRKRQIPEAGLVFIDEAHIIQTFYSDWFTRPEWSTTAFVGLSATPWAKGMGKLYQELIVGTTTQDLIDQGYLSNFRVFAPAHPDLRGIRTVRGDYDETELGAAMDKVPLVADIADTWLKLGRGRPTLCFGVNRIHAEHIQQKFLQAGVRAGYIDCFTKDEERRAIREKFSSGELEVVCNVDVLTMGVDWDVRCIILARPTKSEMKFVQIVGRGLRPAADKDHCLILDHSDTTSRLEFVTDIAHDHLDNGKIRQNQNVQRIRLPKECPQCACLRPIHSNTCPNCGFEARPVDTTKVIEGELQEMRRQKASVELVNAVSAKLHQEGTKALMGEGSGSIRRAIGAMTRDQALDLVATLLVAGWPEYDLDVVRRIWNELAGPAKKPAYSKVEVYGMFKKIAADRGNKPGRAFHLATEYYKGEKPGHEFWHAAHVMPTQDILNFERSRRIAYAKGIEAGQRRHG